jgi:hypothetical protein
MWPQVMAEEFQIVSMQSSPLSVVDFGAQSGTRQRKNQHSFDLIIIRLVSRKLCCESA